MKVSASEELGVRCLTQLARHASKLTISQIARAEGLSDENTAKVMSKLRTLGFVRSIRGKDGGYLLARSADRITIASVLEALAGVVFQPEQCQGIECIHSGECSLRPVWTRLEAMVHGFLASVTIADLAQPESVLDRDLRRRFLPSHHLTAPALDAPPG